MATEDATVLAAEELASAPYASSAAHVFWGNPESMGAVKAGSDAAVPEIALVCSRYNGKVTMSLLEGAWSALESAGLGGDQVTVAWVPGAFELPLAARQLANSGRYAAVVCLGAVVRGDTSHYELVSEQCAAGVQRAQLDAGVPITFGVLATETMAQAEERSGGSLGNKGAEAAMSALEMAHLLHQLPRSISSPSTR